MRLTTRTNLAMRVLMYCATNRDQLVRSAEAAECCNGSLNHIARVVNQLQASGFVETVRGRSGGMRLAREPERISIGAVFRCFEQEIPFAECFDEETNTCPLVSECRLKTYIERALEAFYHELDMVTLADLVQGNCGLQALLASAPQMPGTCTPKAA